MTVLGIDPGWSGGIAVHSGQDIRLEKMPPNALELWRFMQQYPGAQATIELVHAMGKNGCKANFSMGQNQGALRAAMAGAGIIWEEVSPVLWMKRLGELPKGDGAQRTARKNRIKEIMKERHPQLAAKRKITNATADALAILEYALEKEESANRP